MPVENSHEDILSDCCPLTNPSSWFWLINQMRTERVVVYTREPTCREVNELRTIFGELGEASFHIEDITKSSCGTIQADHIEEAIFRLTRRRGLPLTFVKGDCAGDVRDVAKLHKNGFLKSWLETHEYDLIVLGGGSGGLAAAKEAAKFGRKVAVLDYVQPTPIGTKWGLGGTCVNVGCIPKKLMHQAALLGKAIEDAKMFGWQLGNTKVEHNWTAMKDSIQNHIASLNWAYRVELREKEVTYLNAYGSFLDSHTIKAVNKKGQVQNLTADRFLIATGLRPRYIDIPGAKEYCITSDDLFSLKYCPGKTLLVGASYVSLECAGFLKGIGLDVTVMVRSILLRGFDQDMAERIGAQMESIGIRFIREAVPISVERIEDGTPGLYKVTGKYNNGDLVTDTYNTVILAIGRDAQTDDLGLEIPGVNRNPKNKKLVSMNEQTSIPYIYGIGDVLDGKPELTPVAIQAGRFLTRRMFDHRVQQCNYETVPTTVFTPLEYGCCGLSEDAAIEKYGEFGIEVYHTAFKPLEMTVPGRDLEHCYAKLICLRGDEEEIVGFHYLGPNAGEVTQGFAIALQLKAKKLDFDRLVGIHPTCAEIFTTLTAKKSDDKPMIASGC